MGVLRAPLRDPHAEEHGNLCRGWQHQRGPPASLWALPGRSVWAHRLHAALCSGGGTAVGLRAAVVSEMLWAVSSLRRTFHSSPLTRHRALAPLYSLGRNPLPLGLCPTGTQLLAWVVSPCPWLCHTLACASLGLNVSCLQHF